MITQYLNCPWCQHTEELENGIRNNWFTWTNIKGQLLYLCFDCADKVHTRHIASLNKIDELENND